MRTILPIIFILTLVVHSTGQTRLTVSIPDDSQFHKYIFSEILYDVYQEIGIELRSHNVPVKRGLMLANKGDTDGETARVLMVKKKAPNLIAIPIKIFQGNISIFSRKGNKFTGWESLKDKKVSHRRGIDAIEMRLKKNNITAYPVNSDTTMLRLYNYGRVEYLIDGEFSLLRSISLFEKKIGRNIDIETIGEPVIVIKMYHFLHKKHKNLVPKVEAVLKRMEQSGELEKRAKRIYSLVKKDIISSQ